MSLPASNLSFFGPKQVPSLALWLDASDATTVGLSNANVKQWNDKSGNGYNATSIGSGFPTYSSNSIVFTGNQAFATTLQSLIPNQSGFAVVNYSGGGQMNIISVNRTSVGTAGIQQIIFNNNSYKLTTYGAALIVSGSTTLLQNTTFLYNYIVNTTSSNAFMYVNGSQTGQSTGAYSFTGTGTVYIGNYGTNGGLGNEYFNGTMNEILLYSNVITTTQRQQIEGYLAYKWGLQANLPAGHPYRFDSQQTLYPFTSIKTPFPSKNTSFYNFFSPTQISGCVLWLDPSDTTSITLSNANVTKWNDKSGNSNNATAVSNPTLFNINGVQAMNMSNGPYFTGAVSITTTTLTCFAVANTTRTLPNVVGDQRLVSLANTTNVDYGRTDGTIGLFNQLNGSKIGTWRTGPIGSDNITANTPFLAVSQYTGTNGYLWQNGTAGSLTGTASSGNFAITKYAIGNQANPTGEVWQGTIGEVILYNTALTTSQRQQVEGYLAYKWGLQSNLPSTHPMSNNPVAILYKNIVIPLSKTVFITGVNPWLPSKLSGLSLWLDAADSATIQYSSGANISNWIDKSGNGRNGNGFSSPLYVKNVVNKLSAVRFNGTSSYFSIPGNQLDIVNEDFAIFSVIQYTPSANPLPIIGKGSGASAILQWRLNFDTNNQFQIRIYKNSYSILSQTAYTTAGWGLFSGVMYRATTLQAFINASGLSPASTTTIVGDLSDTTTDVEIGRGWGGTQFFNSDMGEILIYKGTITTRQRQQVEGYLAYKWGLRSSLPTNHPYKNIPVS